MSYNVIIAIISYVLFFSSFIVIPVKRNKVNSMAGKCLYGFPRKKIVFDILVEVVAVVLITLNLFIRYSLLSTIVLCACGVLGAWIIIGELSLGKKYGLYENGIVAAGKYFPFDDIMSFPVFNLPKSEQKDCPKNILVIVSRKHGKVEIPFDSDAIGINVVNKLKEMGVIK